MSIKEELAHILSTEDKKSYVYISKSSSALDEVRQHVSEAVDMSKVTTNIYLVHPIGIDKVPKEIDGAFADKGCTSELHMRKHLKFKDEAFIRWVNTDVSDS